MAYLDLTPKQAKDVVLQVFNELPPEAVERLIKKYLREQAHAYGCDHTDLHAYIGRLLPKKNKRPSKRNGDIADESF